MKLREFFKTLILTALVISSVVLASKIWFSEELWSDGYNSFSYNSFIFSKISSLFRKEPKVRSLEYNQIFFPKQLMITNSGVAYLLTGPLNILTFEVNWVYLLIITAVGSVISMIGDLSFSVIKRAFNIKDFGNIMPGHGGVLDRFDSALFVCPVLCLFNSAFPVIIVLS